LLFMLLVSVAGLKGVGMCRYGRALSTSFVATAA
jgi:hypothetical protein